MTDHVIIIAEAETIPVRHTNWSAVFVGALVALMTFLLNLLAAGIGFRKSSS